MCSRITIIETPTEIAEIFDVVRGLDSYEWRPRYNVAPTTAMLCIRQVEDDGRELFSARWGLIPSWSRDTKIGISCINARSETVAEKPAFRAALKARRCLVVATGFYEWQQVSPKVKQPYYMTLKSDEPMPFAGLWETWRSPEGETIVSCTVCTTEANPLMSGFHDRMPVILPHAMIERWLDPGLSQAERILPMLGQFPADEMQAWPVSRDVGNVRNQDPSLVEPISNPAG